MVVGSRAHLEEAAIAKRHWFRNFLMRGFHLLVLLVAGGAVRDTQCGFKVVSKPDDISHVFTPLSKIISDRRLLRLHLQIVPSSNEHSQAC